MTHSIHNTTQYEKAIKYLINTKNMKAGDTLNAALVVHSIQKHIDVPKAIPIILGINDRNKNSCHNEFIAIVK